MIGVRDEVKREPTSGRQSLVHMNKINRWLLILLALTVLWTLFSAGSYLWTKRGQFGFRGTNTYFAREQTSVGTIDFSCTVETPIIVDHQSQFRCVATQIAGSPAQRSNP